MSGRLSTYRKPRRGRGPAKATRNAGGDSRAPPHQDHSEHAAACDLAASISARDGIPGSSHGHDSARTPPQPSTRSTTSTSSPRGTSQPNYHRRPPRSQFSAELTYPLYREAVDTYRAGFFQVDPRTYIAELFDVATGERYRGVHAWTVLQCHADLRGTLSYSCSPCPDFKEHRSCVHVMVLQSADPPSLRPFSDMDNPRCLTFEHWTRSTDEVSQTTFLCMSPAETPVFVAHNGNSRSSGVWTCSRDRGGSCAHISLAREDRTWKSYMERYSNGTETNDEVSSEEEVENDGDHHHRENVDRRSAEDLYEERSISHQGVGPPLWSRLPGDNAESYATVSPIPSVLALGDDARCRCGSAPLQSSSTQLIACTVYGTLGAHAVHIEVRPCSTCRPEARQFAGPDLCELGLFNYNNRRVYTHELLNRFSTSMLAHETPFHAFRTVIQRGYEEALCPIPFVGDDAFRTAWFSFRRIQRLDDSFGCLTCGDNPRIVIFDGVTASFNAKHRTSTLTPPTTVLPGAPRRESTRVPVESTSLVWGRIRANAQKAVRWRLGLTSANKSKLDGIVGDEDADAPDADASTNSAEKQTLCRQSKRDAADAAMRSGLGGLAQQVAAVDKPLGVLFSAFVKTDYTKELEPMRRMYLELLDHIFAYESVLLFVPESCWLALRRLLSDDAAAALVLLRDVPALGVVARFEQQVRGKYSDELKGVVDFILRRAIRVRSSLSNHEFEAATQSTGVEDWRETGTFYGRPRVRLRPEYPHLPGDKKVDRSVVTDAGAGGIGCAKYYEAYGQCGQTGGLMAAWCPHCVCLGFHCIPKGEGRNDVFSALYTRWETAPEVVVYDFACALGPYCMQREPNFFGRTRFLIDGFHAKGHKRCSKACFISSYKKNDPALAAVNSSAAECGNGGLLKIRRPLSYMSQRHAIVYAYTFLAMWNRERRVASARKAAK